MRRYRSKPYYTKTLTSEAVEVRWDGILRRSDIEREPSEANILVRDITRQLLIARCYAT